MLKIPGAFGNGNNRYIAGFDLGDDSSSISYMLGDGQMETVSAVLGEEQFSIPTVLCKREGAGQWFFGREAVAFAEAGQGILVDHLLSKALAGEPVLVDGNRYQPVSLLALFMRRALSLLNPVGSLDHIVAILFTVDQLTHECKEMLQEAGSILKLKTDRIYFQSYTESFYHYMIGQPEELWIGGSILMDYREDKIRIFRMETNPNTSPVVVFIDEAEVPFPGLPRTNVPDEAHELAQLDQAFLNLCREELTSRQPTSVFLIGSRFSDTWMKQSRTFLVTGFRVFRGNNLYSKGAVLGLRNRMRQTEEARAHVFLGNEKLSSNVGMKILRQGEEIYFALLDAGVNWFEAESTFDFYLRDGNTIDFIVTGLIRGGTRIARMTLEDFSGKLSRLRAHLYLTDEHHMVIEVTDLGLGNLAEKTGKTWTENLELA